MNRPALLFLALLTGCVLRQKAPASGDDPGAVIAADTRAYTALQQQLDGNRRQVLDRTAMELAPVGDILYWKTYPGYDPVLHRYDHATGQQVDYGFSLGSGDLGNYRASAKLVVVAEKAEGTIFHVFDAAQANVAIAQLTLPVPKDGARWQAYAVSGVDVYIVDADPAAKTTTLSRWSPLGGGPPQEITTLEAAGAQIGEFLDFSVDGNTMIFVESGRLWHLDLATNRATFLHNQTQIAGSIDFDSDGVIFEDSTGLKYVAYANGTVRDLSAEIMASDYRLSDTYSTGHYFDAATTGINFSHWNRWILYTSGLGIFAFHRDTHAVAPVLLQPIGDPQHRTDYRSPVALSDGTMYVVGLMSDHGDIGADGPVFETDLKKTLP